SWWDRRGPVRAAQLSRPTSRRLPLRARGGRNVGHDRPPVHRPVPAHAGDEHRLLARAPGHRLPRALGSLVAALALPGGRAWLAAGRRGRWITRRAVRGRLPVRHRWSGRGRRRRAAVHRARDRRRPGPRAPEGGAHRHAGAAGAARDGGRRAHRHGRQQRWGGGRPAGDRCGHRGRPRVRTELRRHHPARAVRGAALRRGPRAVPRGAGGHRHPGHRAAAGGPPPDAAAFGRRLARRGRSDRGGGARRESPVLRGGPTHRGRAGRRRRDDRAGRRHPARPVTVQSTAQRARVARAVVGRGWSRRRLPPGSERGRPLMLTAVLVVVALQQPAPPPAPATPPSLPPQVGDTSPFRRLALPTPTLLREGSGRPGPRYWQQRADYTIRASLDTATHTITGSETIRYANNSPDTLMYLWLQLHQNLYRPASRGAAINP